MHARNALALLALAAALAACSAETSTEQGSQPGTTDVGQPGTGSGTGPGSGAGPAGEVPAGTREPTGPGGAGTAPEAAAPKVPAGVDEAWAPFYAHIDFVFGSEAGFAKAEKTGKPMMLLYAATWCSDCKKMAREALADPKVIAAIEKDFVPVLMDFDSEHEWVKTHGISLTPMIQWTDSAGEVMATTEDVQPVARVLEDMDTTLTLIEEFKDE